MGFCQGRIDAAAGELNRLNRSADREITLESVSERGG